MSSVRTIDSTIARRFVMGKQGLWPGRRFHGSAGTAQAIGAMEYLQLDPLQMVARSQDIALASRVVDYSPGMWEQVTYEQRRFFDWGGWLAVRSMEELPHLQVVMQRERDGDIDCGNRVRAIGRDHADAIGEMRNLLRERGVVRNRDFRASGRKRTEDYRGRKDSSLALYYLWRTGEVMTHHREEFERVYALTESVVPHMAEQISSRDESDRFLVKKEIAFFGLSRLQRTADALGRGVPFSKAAQLREQLLTDDAIIEVKVDGWRAMHYALAEDAALLDELSAGRVPAAWTPQDTTTTEEAVFLAPLDHVSARGRAKILFEFDYVWEVYKPAHKRSFGYYTLPILWGDRLVARFDSKLDRASNTLVVLGLWLETEQLGKDKAFAAALGRGFARFTAFLGAASLDVTAIREPLLRRSSKAAVAGR